MSAPQLVEAWDELDPLKPGGGEREVRDALEGLRVEKGRSVLMGRKEEFERIGVWEGGDVSVDAWVAVEGGCEEAGVCCGSSEDGVDFSGCAVGGEDV